MCGVIVASICGVFAFIFNEDFTSFALIGFLFGFIIGIVCFKSDVACPQCDKFFKSSQVLVRTKIISANTVSGIFTGNETMALGEQESFYQCKKCGYEWSEISLYEKKSLDINIESHNESKIKNNTTLRKKRKA